MTTPRLDLCAFAVAAVLAATGCGTATTSKAVPGGAGSSVAVTLEPSSAGVDPDGELAFAATVTGTANTDLTWAVVEGSAGGSIAAGKYKAPASEGVYHVVATSVADSSKSATATVTSSKSRLTITPGTAALNGCQTATFGAKVTGGGSSSVTWAVSEGSAGGSITAAGLYTAPAAAGTYHVVATRAADPTKTAAATVAVTTKVLSVSVSPATASLQGGGTTALAATVVTTCGSFTSP